ncbi:hypothetical protein GGI12_000974 [Dipsacomyces acuminosporus]|nr:hypothetical protein GGI12_000974 [Dipsacomyces acuminosporus]
MLAAELARLSAIAHALAPIDSQKSSCSSVPDIIVWVLAVARVTRARTGSEQKTLLAVIDMFIRNKQLIARLPSEIVALARFPLICAAMDGFSQDICSQAYHLSVDIDQVASPKRLLNPEIIEHIQSVLTGEEYGRWISGRLSLLLNNLHDYLSVYASIYSQRADGSRKSPLSGFIQSMGTISDRPLLLTPLLFEWRLSTGVADTTASVSRLALAKLLSLLDTIPTLRLNLLPLFASALRHPDTPAKLRHALVLHGIPCLASAHDAYATSRVVSVISSLWTRSKGTQLAAHNTSNAPPEQLRLHCLCVRAWANIVVRNPRVWRDFKPAVVQFVETKKASTPRIHKSQLPRAGVDPEYEWTMLVTMRQLVSMEPDRYADQMLPMVFSLLSYAQESLSANSTAILVDIASISIESRMAAVRSVWTSILSKTARYWFKIAAENQSAARPAIEAFAKVCTLVATHGEDSETYAAFRQEILAQYVFPQCGLPRRDDAGAGEPATEEQPAQAVVPEPRTRNMFLSALSRYPMEEVLPLVSAGTPSQIVNTLLVQLSKQQLKSNASIERIIGSPSVSDLLAALMDNEIKFMRRSLITGGSASAKAGDAEDEDSGAMSALGQRQLWVKSNLERSQWLNDVLVPAVSRVRELYQGSGSSLANTLGSGYALAATVGPSGESLDFGSALGNSAQHDGSDSASTLQTADGEDDTSASAESQTRKLVAQLSSLVADVSLADHWCMRNSTADAWSIWFRNAFREIQTGLLANDKDGADKNISAVDTLSAVADSSHRFISLLSDTLRASHIPAHMANALYALIGLVRMASALDQSLGSELSMLVGGIIASTQTLPYTAPPEDFWPNAPGACNEEVLAAAIECIGQVAISNSNDLGMLSQITQFLMAGLTLSASDGAFDLQPVVVQAIARALMYLHAVAAKQKQRSAASHSDEAVVVEADDIRRCVERLGVLQLAGSSSASTGGSAPVDTGRVALAASLATMHRYWIAQLINPALADQNASPRASQAMRVVAQTLTAAYNALDQLEDMQWSQTAVASLYYLCFVWPPRPITQRHLELHRALFTVTPDQVWQVVTRLVRRLWTSLGSEHASGADLGFRRTDVLNFVEVAYSTLAYHVAMTSSQNSAHLAHARLIKQYSESIEGDMAGSELAATEKPSFRANRIISLAILLGVPMHGIPETTVSNEYLPAEQQKNLPVLLGIGSVQYGSTAWLRLSEPALQAPLQALLVRSGLHQHSAPGGSSSQADAADESSADPADTSKRGQDANTVAAAEIEDIRAARIASFVLGALWSQSARAIQLLLIDEKENQIVSATNSSRAESGGSQKPKASTGLLDESPSKQVQLDTAVAADEEPKHLGRLPAPTSWTRAVWESICELSESLVDASGGIVESIEGKLAYLLLAMYRTTRPFPLVDSRKVFGRVVAAYLSGSRLPAELGSAQMPLLTLVSRVASKLSPVSYSMTEFLTSTLRELLAQSVSISTSVPAADQYVRDERIHSLLDLTLGYLGDIGLGRILRLSGLASVEDSAVTISDKSSTSDDGIPSTRQITGADASCVQSMLSAAISSTLLESLQRDSAQTLPGSSNQQGSVTESDGERMFRVMSKVSLPAAVVVNLCAAVAGKLFAGGDLVGAVDSPVLVALRARALKTLQSHVTCKDVLGLSQGVAVSAAREKIADSLLLLLKTLDATAEHSANAKISKSRELALISSGIVASACCGAVVHNGDSILNRDPSALGAGGFCSLVEQQALVLEQWVSRSSSISLGASNSKQTPGTKATRTAADIKGVVGDWLKHTVKEWARRCRQAGEARLNADAGLSVAWSLQNVAAALYKRNRIASLGSMSNAEARRLTVQALDMAILGSSIACAGKEEDGERPPADFADRALAVILAGWLLPLLTGVRVDCTGSASSGSLELLLLGVSAGEMQDQVYDIGGEDALLGGNGAAKSAEQEPAWKQQYPAQLRSRVRGLFGLARSPAAKRALRLVLANLAVLGMLPSSDLQAVV